MVSKENDGIDNGESSIRKVSCINFRGGVVLKIPISKYPSSHVPMAPDRGFIEEESDLPGTHHRCYVSGRKGTSS